MSLRAYILRPTGKAETTTKKLWDIVSIHHGDSPPPHLGMRCLREFIVVENFQLADDTGIDDELRTKRIALADWPVLAYPYEAIAVDARGQVEQRLRSLRFLNHDLLPAQLRADAITIGKPLPRIDAAKVGIVIATRSKPAGTITRSTGGLIR